MIATKTTIITIALVLTQCLHMTKAQNESFPWVYAEQNKVVAAGLLDQRVYVTNTGDQSTYYSLSIK